MSRYVIMGTDECGQEFNAGDKYYSCQEEAYAELPRIREQYEEARSIWVEPLFSDMAYVSSWDEEMGFGESWEDEY